jgi:leader peptidase (prepilin peptidase)/N-methyltransferase
MSAYRPCVYVLLIAVATVWGAGSGLLIPRIAYRLAVEPDEPWRTECPGGHPITGPLGGWLGRARCAGGVTAEAGAFATRVPFATRIPNKPDQTPMADEAPVMGGALAASSTGADDAAVGQTAPAPAAGHTPGTPATAAAQPPHCRYGPGTTTVALITALVCAALAAATGPRPEAVVWLLAVPVAVLLASVDHAVHRLPDILTLSLAAGLVVLLGLAALLPGDAGSWPKSLLGAVILGTVYFVLFIINSKGMGFGDVKLALALGAALGWYGLMVLVIGFLAGLVLAVGYGLTLIVLRRAGRKSSIPLGPFMLSGTFLGLVLGAL